MSNRSKGVTNERKARECYEAAGYCPASTSTGTRWGDTDMFNKFDAIALHPRRRIRFIQVKSNSTGGDLGDFFDWCSYNLPPDCAVAHFLVRYDRDGWKLYEQDRQSERGYKIPVDERNADCNIGERLTAYLSGETVVTPGGKV